MRFWRKHKAEENEVADAAEGEQPGEAAVAVLEPAAEDDAAELHEQTEKALERTRKGLFGRIAGMFERADFDEDLWDELEEIMVASDTGVGTTEAILSRVKQAVKASGVKQSLRVREILRDELVAILEEPATESPAWDRDPQPSPMIVLVVGVNGAGKTTTIAKMAYAFKHDGAAVILGAADTFRAAASDQLKVWGDRVGVRVIAHKPGADPGAVVFDTLTAAENSAADIVIIDTAGRLHTKTNLMEELKKMDRIIQRNHPEGPHETLLVLDATTGQNGLQQAKTFTAAVGVSGIVLAKLDGTAKGGIAFAIAHELRIPVRFIGTGEKLGDLAPFDAREFVDSLLGH
ncbi:MAG: signal recognition particle-docking protein FtsY [Chloroflexi bacterium]|nr:signal recognition particle-docking protein FtsY [Chloroflexota bacterium]